MKVKLKTAFSILDGRLSSDFGDVFQMFNYIFSDNLYTHQIPTAMRKLNEVNPGWFQHGKDVINGIKEKHKTDDFFKLMEIIDKEYSTFEIELQKIDFSIEF